MADCHSILAGWRNNFSQLLNVHGANDVRQTEVHSPEPLVPEHSAVGKLKRHKSGIDQIPAEMIKAGGRTIYYEIHKLINCISNKEELSEQWKESITIPICKKGDKTDYINYRGISLLSSTNTYKILSKILLSRLSPYAGELTGHHQCGF